MATDPTKADFHRLWDELEAALTSLLEDLQATADVKIILDVRHYVEHREYGLALETLYYGARASKCALTHEQDAKCQDLARRMGITLPA